MKTRNFKFRVWDKKEAVMHRVLKMVLGASWIVNDNIDTFNEEDAVLMQFTGLLDVNGKEIYEGDIVKSLSYNEIQEIKWHEHLFVESEENNGFPSCAGWFIHTPHSSELEIIGNIYQNPEILTN